MYTINDLCLLCLENNNNLKTIVSEDCDGVPIEEKLRSFLFEFATIKPDISENNRICLRCLEKLNDITNYKQQCIQNIIKLNSYVHLLNDSNEPCGNVPVTSINFQNLKGNLATPNNKKHTDTVVKTLDNQLQENNFGTNVIIKKEPLEHDSKETELEGPDERISTAEVDVQILEENIVKIEQEIADYDANEKEENYFEAKQGAINVDDVEMKYENFEEITIKEENFCDEAEANDRNEFPNETSNAATSPTNENIPEIERTNKKLYSRKDCNKSFHYITDQSYKCPTCHKTFEHSQQLRNHKRIHSNARPHKCSVCNKAFAQKVNLTRHERIHTGEKPYTCNECNKAFAQSSSLTKHERIHSGKKPYKCNVCNEAFATSSHLVTHERIHTGIKLYKCNECDRAFAQSSDLTKHKRIHTGIKPYTCNVCNKAFARSSHLVTHERIHTGIKPYKCNVCNMAFTQRSNLTTHERLHSSKKILLM